MIADTDTIDAAFRQAAFDHLRGLLAGRSTIDRTSMGTPFFVGQTRLTLVDPRRGIHKPKAMRHLLSITTALVQPGRKVWYADQTAAHQEIYSGETGVRYSFMGEDPNAAQNQALRDATEYHLPVIYFLGVKPALYQPFFPVFLEDWDAQRRSVRVVFSPAFGAATQTAFPIHNDERRYAMRLVKQRLHQTQFREAVIDAYDGRCAVSGLAEPRLLDAAHIVADAAEELGHPIVPNGIPLSKIHHAAYDANLLGIDADGVVHVSERLLTLHDGPLLEHGIKGMAGRRLLPPKRQQDQPDRERLDLRFQSYRKVA